MSKSQLGKTTRRELLGTATAAPVLPLAAQSGSAAQAEAGSVSAATTLAQAAAPGQACTRRARAGRQCRLPLARPRKSLEIRRARVRRHPAHHLASRSRAQRAVRVLVLPYIGCRPGLARTDRP